MDKSLEFHRRYAAERSAATSEMLEELFVAGEWIGGTASGRTFGVTNPSNGETVAVLPDGGHEEMQTAIDAAAAAQPEWAERAAADRAAIMQGAARLMHERKEHLARVMTLEQGKPLAESRGEIVYAASFIEWFAEEGKRVYGETVPASFPDKRIFVIKRPVGVTAAITPWNFPAAMITRKLGPALAAGCAMVIKPARLTPLSALEMAKIFEEAGLPKGLLSVVVGTDTSGMTSAIMEDERVRKLSFTGSTEVGKLLMKQSADTMKRLSLELGGHAPSTAPSTPTWRPPWRGPSPPRCATWARRASAPTASSSRGASRRSLPRGSPRRCPP